MDVIKLLIGLLAGFAGMFLYERTKRKSLENIVGNLDILKKIGLIDNKIDSNSLEDKKEESNRKSIEENLNKESNDKQDLEKLKKFFDNN